MLPAAVAVLERPAADEDSQGFQGLPGDDLLLLQLRDAGDRDPSYVLLRDAVLGVGEMPATYRKVSGELWVHQGLVMYGRRIVVPLQERKTVVAKLHAAHLGEERTLQRARQAVYWPGITADVKSHVRACSPCQKLRPSQQPQPVERDQAPTFAFQEVAADFGEIQGRHSWWTVGVGTPLCIPSRVTRRPPRLRSPCSTTSPCSGRRYVCFRTADCSSRRRSSGAS